LNAAKNADRCSAVISNIMYVFKRTEETNNSYTDFYAHMFKENIS